MHETVALKTLGMACPLPRTFSVYFMPSLAELGSDPWALAFMLPAHVALVFPELSLFQPETQATHLKMSRWLHMCSVKCSGGWGGRSYMHFIRYNVINQEVSEVCQQLSSSTAAII